MAMLSFERKYRVRGGTLIGGDLLISGLDRFTSDSSASRRLFSPALGIALILWGAAIGPTWNIWQISIAPPDLKYGLGACAAARRRIVADHHGLRDRLLCLLGAARSRNMPEARHRLPCALRLQRRDFRLCLAGRHPPGSDGRLGLRLPLRYSESSRLGVEHRLSISALPLQSGPYARRVVLLHDVSRARAARLACAVGHQSRQGQAVKSPEHEDTFFRDAIGYSIGTLGIHRLGLFLALSAAFWSAVCIIISGPFWTRGWPEWWSWWLNLPIWR